MKLIMDVRPDDMLVFAAVVRAGSFSRAAAELGTTKQAASLRVRRLEVSLGVRLLERSTRRLRPTDAGAVYAKSCQAIASQIAEANELARERQAQPLGVLRVASPTLYGRRFLTPVVSRYSARFPRVQVVVTLTNRPVDLIADGFDLAVQVGRLKDSDYTARRLGDGHLFFVASPAYLDRDGSPSPLALPAARCLGLRAEEDWQVDERRLRIRPVVAINDLESLHDLAVAGAGIARLPSFLCREALADGRLRRLFPRARVSVRQISALYPSRTFLAARVERFLELLAGEMTPLKAQ